MSDTTNEGWRPMGEPRPTLDHRTHLHTDERGVTRHISGPASEGMAGAYEADDALVVHRHGAMRGTPVVRGRCPACGVASLGLGSGGYVTCANLSCSDPSAASDLLDGKP